ncbi:hypothetical protein R82526_02580 [Ralstonia mannitolilytica]|nr:hypothetical protein R82526_02580 [Ralstonia mannitolilytica]
MKRLYDVTQAVTFLPYVSRSSVQSLWTPNSFVNEITEEGFRADPLIPGTVTPDRLDATAIGDISRSTAQGGFVGSLVSRDQTSAMVTADLNEVNASGKRIDYVSFDRMLESELRKKFEDDKYEIQIIGFAKQIGDIAEGAAAVLQFCLMALLLTALRWVSASTTRSTSIRVVDACPSARRHDAFSCDGSCRQGACL